MPSKLPFKLEVAYETFEELIELLFNFTWCIRSTETMDKLCQQFRETRDTKSQSILSSVYKFTETGIWSGGDPGEEIPIFIDLFELTLPPYLSACHMDEDRKKIWALYDLLYARLAIDPLIGFTICFNNADPHLVSRKQIALLEGKAEDTIRAAMYATGDAQLKPVKDDLYDPVEVKRWQLAKNTFQPSLLEWGHELEPKFTLNSIWSMRDWLTAFSDRQNSGETVSYEQIRNAVDQEERQTFELFWQKAHNEDIDDTAMTWFTTPFIKRLATLLRISPRWLAEQGFNVINKSRNQRLMSELPTNDDFVSMLEQQQTINSPCSTPATEENITMMINAQEWIKPHPLQRGKANSKMNGYLSDSGTTFTHEHNLKKQYIWLLKSQAEAINCKKKYYPKNQLNLHGQYGRHSGLKKYDALAFEDLYRLEIKTSGELKEVLEHLK